MQLSFRIALTGRSREASPSPLEATAQTRQAWSQEGAELKRPQLTQLRAALQQRMRKLQTRRRHAECSRLIRRSESDGS